MKIDNSAATLFRECPDKYRERYVNNLERKITGVNGLSFGTRFHELLAIHYGKPLEEHPLPEPEESEIQEMLAAYKATYPQEPFEVVAVEQYFEVPIGPEVECKCGVWETSGEPMLQSTKYGLQTIQPTKKVYKADCPECKGKGSHSKHIYIGKRDADIRMLDSGRMKVFETKTEKRGGKANLPTAWASRDQGSLYLYAGAYAFGEAFDGVVLNVCSRGSEKGLKPPSFRRDRLERSPEQILLAVRDIIQTADAIEACVARYGPEEPWLQHRENCTNKMTGWNCDYFDLHTYGRSPELIQIDFQQAKPYLI